MGEAIEKKNIFITFIVLPYKRRTAQCVGACGKYSSRILICIFINRVTNETYRMCFVIGFTIKTLTDCVFNGTKLSVEELFWYLLAPSEGFNDNFGFI